MLGEFTLAELQTEYARAAKMAALCRDHGFADGANAAEQQANACMAEIEARNKPD